MEKIFQQEMTTLTTLGEIIMGSLLVTIGSMIVIPLQPVPITFQTVALLLLALTQRPLVCFSSLTLYLLEGTLGFPVFGGYPNPLWFSGKMAGYLIGFPIAGYVISLLIQGRSSFNRVMVLILGQFIIHFFGVLVLSKSIGFSAAFNGGFLFFVPIDVMKAFLSLSLLSVWHRSPFSLKP